MHCRPAVAVFDVYGSLFDRVLYLRGTSRDELAERLAGAAAHGISRRGPRPGQLQQVGRLVRGARFLPAANPPRVPLRPGWPARSIFLPVWREKLVQPPGSRAWQPSPGCRSARPEPRHGG